MNEILKQLMERGYYIRFHDQSNEYTVQLANIWSYDPGMTISYEKIIQAMRQSVNSGMTTDTTMIMSRKTYKAVKKLLGKK